MNNEIAFLYKLTGSTSGHGHKPERLIVAPDIVTAIHAFYLSLDTFEKSQNVEVRWVETLSHVDLIATKKEVKK